MQVDILGQRGIVSKSFAKHCLRDRAVPKARSADLESSIRLFRKFCSSEHWSQRRRASCCCIEPLSSVRSSETHGESGNGARIDAITTEPTSVSALESKNSQSGALGTQPRRLRRRTPRSVHKDVHNDLKEPMESPLLMVTRPLPHVLILHTGGTLGMDPAASYEAVEEGVMLRRGTGGVYAGSRGSGLRPGTLLKNVLALVPELNAYANLKLQVAYNKDSSNVGPQHWKQLAMMLHRNRDAFDAFLVIHGTDTMAYTASALSLMLAGFRKPIVLTGSQLPLAMPRSDARQNLIDSVTCLTSFFSPPHVRLEEVSVCFGGRLMRGNRVQKVHSSFYQAFDSLNYPHLANLGVDIEWNRDALLRVSGVYRPRFELDPNVIRVPIIPGCNPKSMYGDVVERGVRGIVLEAFGVGNLPDLQSAGWLPWLSSQMKKGLLVYLASQCLQGPLQPELYKSGMAAMELGAEAGPQMTPECSVVKMMQCLRYPNLPLGVPIAGEM